MTKSLILIPLSILSCSAVAEFTVAVETISDGQYQLTLTSGEVADPGYAQTLLLSTAQLLCEERSPQFGHYRFESMEPLAEQSSSDEGTTFLLVQDIECVSSDAEIEDKHISFLSGPEERITIENEVKLLSESYFSEIVNGDYESAYASYSDVMKSFRTYEEWTTQMDALRADAGNLVRLDVHTITIYDNPSNSPEPGLYVAADYQNQFSKAPYHCGLLIWFRSAEGQFEIIREETGLITNQILLEVPKEQHQNLLARLRCRAR